MVLVGSCAGTFYALDKNTGGLEWSYDIRMDGNQSSFHGDPLVAGDLVIIGTDGKEGRIYAFERSSGLVRWQYVAPREVSGERGVTSDILRAGSSIFAVAIGDELTCLDLESGRPRWTFASGPDRKESIRNVSPAVGEGRVFFAGLDGAVYALDASSGKVIWKKALGAAPSTAVTLQGKDLYVGLTNRHLYRLSRLTGEIVADFAAEADLFGTPTVAGDSLLVILNWMRPGGELVSLDLSLDRVRWRRQAAGSGVWTSPRPYLRNGTVVLGDSAGEVYAFRSTDGSVAWSHQFKGKIKGIGIAEDRLFIGTLEGLLFAHRPERAPGG